jgi:hypothetical protein
MRLSLSLHPQLSNIALRTERCFPNQGILIILVPLAPIVRKIEYAIQTYHSWTVDYVLRGDFGISAAANIFRLHRQYWAFVEATSVYFAARRFLTLGLLPDRAEGVGDFDSLVFPSWTLV